MLMEPTKISAGAESGKGMLTSSLPKCKHQAFLTKCWLKMAEAGLFVQSYMKDYQNTACWVQPLAKVCYKYSNMLFSEHGCNLVYFI